MGFWASVGKVIQEGSGGTAGIIGSELLEHGPFETFDQPPVGIFVFQPFQSQTEQGM